MKQALWLIAIVFATGCTQRASIQFVTMPPGTDADLTITGDDPPLPRALVEVRNVGDWIADVSIEEAQGWGSTPAPMVVGPKLPLTPNETWQTHVDKGLLLRLHNKGDRDAKLQVFTPAWTSLALVMYPKGRDQPERTVIVDEPGADGVKREPPVRGQP